MHGIKQALDPLGVGTPAKSTDRDLHRPRPRHALRPYDAMAGVGGLAGLPVYT